MVDTKEKWGAWTLNGLPILDDPGGAVHLTEDGWVKVGFIQRDHNACLNASRFSYKLFGGSHTGGIRGAGSNPAAAGNVMDGDSTTYWAPSPGDDVEKWWIELDLGRAVTATQLRLRFAPGRAPFPEFKIYVSTGNPKFPGTSLRVLDYELIFSTIKPHTEPTFEYTFSDTDLHDRPLSGRLLQFVKIFFPARVQNPGLAEVEVIELGDNIALGTRARGGSARSGQVSDPVNLFDGMLWTGWRMTRMGSDWLQGINGPWVNWDLGAQFWVEKIKLTTRPIVSKLNRDISDFMDGFKVYASDGTEALASKPEVWRVAGDREVQWELIADVNNTLVLPALQNFEINLFPPKRVRYLFFHHFYGTSIWRTGYAFGPYLFEFELFGEGFLPGVTLQSPLYDLGKSVNLYALSWKADTPPGTRIAIRTRTGDRVQEITHWYDVNGTEKTEQEYKRLPSFKKGPIIKEPVPDEEHWSGWSEVYQDPEGSPFASPSPRRYLLIQMDLLSDDPQVAPSIHAITLSHSEPAAQTVFGEIEPNLVTAEPGAPQRFRYTIRPTYAPGNTGFDRILIRTPSQADSVTVHIADQTITPRRIEASRDSLFIQLPTRVRREQVEIFFHSIPFFNSMLFEGFVSGTAGVWQRIDPDPSKKTATTVMVSELAEANDLIGNLTIEPGVFTPNGDGVHDQMAVRFTLLKVEVPRRITVEVYDLRGHRIKPLYCQSGVSGNYGFGGEIAWDGGDDAGQRVAPGVYICQINVTGDARDTVISRTVIVTY